MKRENDFKISPVHLKIAVLNALASQCRDVTKEMRYLFAEKAVYSFTHAENYSRILHDGYFFYRKGLYYYFGDNYEQAACAFNAVQYFKQNVDRRTVIESIVKSSNCMAKLGYAEHCLPVLDKLIEEYHQDPHLLLQKIYCSDICAKSKAELRNIVKEYKQLAENLRNKMKEEPQYRAYMTCIEYAESRSELLEKDISNPKLAESW